MPETKWFILYRDQKRNISEHNVTLRIESRILTFSRPCRFRLSLWLEMFFGSLLDHRRAYDCHNKNGLIQISLIMGLLLPHCFQDAKYHPSNLGINCRLKMPVRDKVRKLGCGVSKMSAVVSYTITD